MKKLRFYILPALAGVLAAVVIIFALNSGTGAASPEKAVVSYLKASYSYNAGGIVKYASRYQKIQLNDGKDFTDSSLKKKLKNYYKNAENIYDDDKIAFSVTENKNLHKNSDEYAEVLEKYEFLAGKSDISAINKITVKVMINGEEKQINTVYSIKEGSKWYYGITA